METLATGSIWTDLSLWANLGSLAGFVITVIAFFRLRYVRRNYLLLTRGQEQIKRLRSFASEINKYPDLSQAQIKLVLGQCRSTLKGLGRKVDWRTRFGLRQLRSTMKKTERNLSEESIYTVYAELHRVILELSDTIQDKKWKLPS